MNKKLTLLALAIICSLPLFSQQVYRVAFTVNDLEVNGPVKTVLTSGEDDMGEFQEEYNFSAKGNITNYSYCSECCEEIVFKYSAGKLISSTSTTADEFGTRIIRTTYTTDAKGRVIKSVSRQTGTSPETATYKYLNGQLVEHTDAWGNHTTFTYDANGKLIKAVDNYGTTYYSYDAQGRLIKIDNRGTDITRYYSNFDKYGNWTTESIRSATWGNKENTRKITYWR